MVVCMPVAFLENLNLLTIEKTIVLKNLTLFRTLIDYATYNKYFKIEIINRKQRNLINLLHLIHVIIRPPSKISPTTTDIYFL